jgi:hypothetical protein
MRLYVGTASSYCKECSYSVHLNMNFLYSGLFTALWRHPSSPSFHFTLFHSVKLKLYYHFICFITR